MIPWSRPIVPHGMGVTVLGTPMHVSHPTWLCPTCPSRPIVPHGMGGTVLGTPMHVSHPTWLCPTCPSRPIIPHGMGGTVLGTPMCPTLHGSVPRVRPVPSSHMGQSLQSHVGQTMYDGTRAWECLKQSLGTEMKGHMGVPRTVLHIKVIG